MLKRLIFTMVFLGMSLLLSAQSVGLVLSGGGAKGVSHIGIIRALEENNIPIDYISGTSMGAIVAGLYAIGLTPDEMLILLESEEFISWSNGLPEKEFASYLYRRNPVPEAISIGFYSKIDKKGKKKMELALPTNLISSYPMDIAVIQLFASSASAANYDFSKLMIPFFCVSSDIEKKKEYVSTSGDLGSAIRASMTFPGYFKPVVIDSTLLFDGGMYNNFPVDVMKNMYNPDYIIGAKCVVGEKLEADDDELLKQVELMLTVDTDYDIPRKKGIVISDKYEYGLMEFDKSREIARQGYETAIKSIPEIKQRVKRRMSDQDLLKKRLQFRMKCPELIFDTVSIQGNVSKGEKEYIINTLLGDERDTVNFNQIKNGYYQLVESKTLSSIYPTAKIEDDSLFKFNLRVKKKNKFKIGVGGNISTSSLTQGYVGVSYIHLGRFPFRANADFNIGHYYQGASLYFRQDVYDNPLVFYDFEYTMQRFDYYVASRSFLFDNFMSDNVIEDEMFVTANLGLPLSKNNNVLIKFGGTLGYNRYKYFDTDSYSKYDEYDRTNLKYLSPRVLIQKNSLNYRMYPNSGKNYKLDLRYSFVSESFIPGTLSSDETATESVYKNILSGRLTAESYYELTKFFRLGYQLDLSISNNFNMNNHLSAMLVLPAFQPTVHSSTLILDKYRAPMFLGIALSPIFMISPTIYFHTTFAYFQPYKRLIPSSDGGYSYSSIFPMGSFMANCSAVWQSPIGPLSVSCAYYDNDGTKWFPQINIGILLFKNRGLRN